MSTALFSAPNTGRLALGPTKSAFERGLLSVSNTVVSPVTTVSLIVGTVNVCEVLPARNVRVPTAGV